MTQPLTWVAVLLLLAVLLPRRPHLARALVAAALGLLLLIGWRPLPDHVMRHLEGQYAEMPTQADLRGFVGMVVLGGSTEPGYVAQDHVQPLLTSAAERMTAPVALLRTNPHLRVIYTGGDGDWLPIGPPEAQLAKAFFDTMGVPPQAVQYESASRTTQENARLAAELPGVDIHQRWLLVTSAYHMPRAMATFARAGWNVTAYPVDFRTGSRTPWTAYSLQNGVRTWQLALHELLGAAAYRAAGWL